MRDQRERICFLHVPSCGGTTLARYIAQFYPSDRTLIGGGAPDEWQSWFRSREYEKYDFFSGHFFARDAKIVKPDFKIITLVRDPLTRAGAALRQSQVNESWILGKHGNLEDYACAWARDASKLEDYLDPASDAEPDRPEDQETFDRIDRFFDCVGVTELFSLSIARISQQILIPLDQYKLYNKSPLEFDIPISSEFIDIINKSTAMDRCIYNFFRSKLVNAALTEPDLVEKAELLLTGEPPENRRKQDQLRSKKNVREDKLASMKEEAASVREKLGSAREKLEAARQRISLLEDKNSQLKNKIDRLRQGRSSDRRRST